MTPADILRRVSALRLPARVVAGVMELIADIQEEVDAAAKERDMSRDAARQRKQKSRDRHRTVTGQSCDSHSDKKEIPPTPPKEKTLTQVSSETFVSPRIRSRQTYAEDFENRFWKPYPRTPTMSKVEAFKAWRQLSDDDHVAAIAAVPQYAAWLKGRQNQEIVHACRFLSQRRFDGFTDAAQPTQATLPVGFYAADGSEELTAWDAYSRETKGVNAPRDRNQGWRFPTQWPPGHEQKSEQAA